METKVLIFSSILPQERTLISMWSVEFMFKVDIADNLKT